MDKAASRIRLRPFALQNDHKWRAGVFLTLQKPIKSASEISRIKFLFVTLFYCLYDICISTQLSL